MIFLMLSLALSSLSTLAYAQHPTLFGNDFNAALKAAKRSGNPVLIDVYTTWCKPCKMLDKEVFEQPDVIELLRANFEAVKLDAERGAGVDFVKRYGVQAYPTVLVVDASGQELDRMVGYPGAAAARRFFEGIKAAPSPGSFAALQSRHAAGERDTASLHQLVRLGRELQHPAVGAYVADLLDATGGWSSERADGLVMRYASTDNRLFDTLVTRRAASPDAPDTYLIDERIAVELDRALFGTVPARRRVAKRLIERAYPMRADSTYLRYRMRVAREAGRARRYGRLAVKWQDRYPTTDPDELAELIYIFESRLPGWKEEQVEAWKVRKGELLDVRSGR